MEQDREKERKRKRGRQGINRLIKLNRGAVFHKHIIRQLLLILQVFCITVTPDALRLLTLIAVLLYILINIFLEAKTSIRWVKENLVASNELSHVETNGNLTNSMMSRCIKPVLKDEKLVDVRSDFHDSVPNTKKCVGSVRQQRKNAKRNQNQMTSLMSESGEFNVISACFSPSLDGAIGHLLPLIPAERKS